MSERGKYQLACSPEEIAELLNQTRWASDFSWDQMKRMGKFFKAYRMPDDKILCKQGDVDKSMGILLKGRLQVVTVDQGQKRLLATVNAPQTFGEFSFIDGQPRSAYIVAYTEVEFLQITREGLDNMAAEHPMIAYQLLSKISYILSQRLRRTTGKLKELLDVSTS